LDGIDPFFIVFVRGLTKKTYDHMIMRCFEVFRHANMPRRLFFGRGMWICLWMKAGTVEHGIKMY
jgi:hypothetical protein